MTDNREKLLDKVRALLAKAEATEYEEEAQSFMAGAQRLIAAHAIADGELHVKDQSEIIRRTLRVDEPYSKAKAHILAALMDHVGFYFYMNHRTQKDEQGKYRTMFLFGTETALDLAEAIFTSLLLQSTRQSLKLKGSSPGETKSMRDRFLVGFAVGLSRQLKKATEDTPGAGLVLLNEKDRARAEVDVRVTTEGGKRASQDGIRAGENADVGRERLRGQKALGA